MFADDAGLPAYLETGEANRKFYESFGFEVTILPVDGDGLVRVDDLRAAIRPTTVLVSIMYANNEVGKKALRNKKKKMFLI